MTISEDQSIKLWSKTGMLRNEFIKSDALVLNATWSIDSNFIAYSNHTDIIIKGVKPGKADIKKKATIIGTLLVLEWS